MVKDAIKLHNRLQAFLEREGCKKQYYDNLMAYYNKRDIKTQAQRLLSEGIFCKGIYMISTPFVWCDTPEDYNFWSSISAKWEVECR